MEKAFAVGFFYPLEIFWLRLVRVWLMAMHSMGLDVPKGQRDNSPQIYLWETRLQAPIKSRRDE
jgi:hypothetical protein